MHEVRARVQGCGPDLLALFAQVEASTVGHLCEDGHVHAVQPLARPLRLLGNAVTVALPPVDGSVIREALLLAQPGDVLVIEMAEGDRHRACWGELRTLAALKKGLAGVVVAGCVTDVRALAALNLPVFSLGVSALTTRSLNLGGAVNVPVRIGGVRVRPGDLVLGDDDGLFILDPAAAPDIGTRALAKRRQDAERRAQLT